MNIYLISGLGANYRAFQHLSFPPEHTIIHITWIDPLPGESLEHYACRLAEAIDAHEPFVLIGLSFGGMIATEIGKLLSPQKIILISSISSYTELPRLYKIGGKLGLHKMIPARAGNRNSRILYWILGLQSNYQKQLFLQIMSESNTSFTRWAIEAILRWKQRNADPGVIRIHGNKDRLLPITGFAPQYIIPKGGHLMVADKALEISTLIDRILKS